MRCGPAGRKRMQRKSVRPQEENAAHVRRRVVCAPNACDAAAIGAIMGEDYGGQTEGPVRRAEAALSADGEIAAVPTLAGMGKAGRGQS